MREIRDTPSGTVLGLAYTQAYAKNAYAWPKSQHASGVSLFRSEEFFNYPNLFATRTIYKLRLPICTNLALLL